MHLNAEEVQRTAQMLDAWKDELERRTGRNFLAASRKTDWQRTRSPRLSMRARTWHKHLERLLGNIQEDWNARFGDGEERLAMSRDQFFKGPPSLLMQAKTGADLHEMPVMPASSVEHLHGYLHDLRARVEQTQMGGHITAERALRNAIAATLESLEAWEGAACELTHVITINEALGDHSYVAQALLQQGIAYYRAEKFDQAKEAFERPVMTIRDRLPPNASMRTHLRVWNYLGLCHVRLGQPAKALKIFLDKDHQKRSRMLSTPLGDASRSVDTGIAYLELGEHKKARTAILRGLELRLQVGALAEAARALRYLGLLYSRERKWVHALTVWEVALKLQRGLGNEIEQTKLHFFRGSAFAEIWEHSMNPGGIKLTGRIECSVSPSLFPDVRERGLLAAAGRRFRDPVRSYMIHSCCAAAQSDYRQCIETGIRRNLTSWVSGAETGLKKLALAMRNSSQTACKNEGCHRSTNRTL